MPGQKKQTDLDLLINGLQAMHLEPSATPCLSRYLHRRHGPGIREIADVGKTPEQSHRQSPTRRKVSTYCLAHWVEHQLAS